jgi:hypothetical protein
VAFTGTKKNARAPVAFSTQFLNINRRNPGVIVLHNPQWYQEMVPGEGVMMVEIATAVGVVVCTGAVIRAGVALGSKYIDQKLRYEDTVIPPDQPVVRPSHPAGLEWTEAA